MIMVLYTVCSHLHHGVFDLLPAKFTLKNVTNSELRQLSTVHLAVAKVYGSMYGIAIEYFPMFKVQDK